MYVIYFNTFCVANTFHLDNACNCLVAMLANMAMAVGRSFGALERAKDFVVEPWAQASRASGLGTGKEEVVARLSYRSQAMEVSLAWLYGLEQNGYEAERRAWAMPTLEELFGGRPPPTIDVLEHAASLLAAAPEAGTAAQEEVKEDEDGGPAKKLRMGGAIDPAMAESTWKEAVTSSAKMAHTLVEKRIITCEWLKAATQHVEGVSDEVLSVELIELVKKTIAKARRHKRLQEASEWLKSLEVGRCQTCLNHDRHILVGSLPADLQ